MNFLDELNDAQRQAVLNTEGPTMVIAGAGSGKTKVLTYRIAYLLANGVDAFNILALTFTNKAAKEMKERIAHIVGAGEAQNLWMGTFHSVFAKILRIEAEKIGFPKNFTIYDTEDAKSLIKTILKEMNLDEKIYKLSHVYGRISNAKNNLYSPQAYLQNAEIMAADRYAGKPLIGEIYVNYQRRLYKASAMDFDDLLFNTNILLQNHPDVLHKYQSKFKYILVDEYQDTNVSQYLIVKRLAALYENICVVGDDAQSIYAFRGANIQNILNFERDYPDMRKFMLEQNYRSTSNIVQAANTIIWNNKEQIKKEVWTQNEAGDKIEVYRAGSDNEEGQIIAQEIFQTLHSNQLKNKDFAILYRTNAQSRALEEALRKKNIPYRIYGGISFYQRKEIKDLLAYFRLSINQNDEESLKRIINYPARGIGDTTLNKIFQAANNSDNSIWQILANISNINIGLNRPVTEKLIQFTEMIASFKSGIEKENAYDLALRIATSSGILKELYNDKTPEGVSRYENLQELLNGVKEFTEQYKDDTERTLADFMQEIALLTDADNDNPEDFDKVSLMTIHASKGLEFPYVFIAGLEEGLFPSQLSLESREDLEEERRLFYVAVTRAKKKANLSFAVSRFKFGSLIYAEPSRFIDEIDKKYIQKNYSDQSPILKSAGNNFFGNASIKNTFAKPEAPKNQTNSAQFGVDLANFKADDPKTLQTGMQIEHPKFGIGTIENIEGADDNLKATIHFKAFGQKQLLLKFAKIRKV
jgi:DNA helicase-2/ATP-dependent DNA helicase PcrA